MVLSPTVKKDVSLSRHLIDELTARVQQLSDMIDSQPFDIEAERARRERSRLWQVIEYAAGEVATNYHLVYVPATFEGISYFFSTKTYERLRV